MAKKTKTDEVEYHVYDFVIRTKLNRNAQEVIEKKYSNSGLKTIKEWEELTGVEVLSIFK